MFPTFAGDSLRFCSRPAAGDTGLWVGNSPSPESVFGAGSQLTGIADTGITAVNASIAYSIVLLACLVGWILILYIYRDYILAALRVVRGGAAADKLLEKQNKLFSAYLNWAVVLGGATIGLACSHDIVTAGICSVAGVTVWGFQWITLAAAGRLTLYTEFTTRLFFLRKIVMAAGSMVLVPLFLLYALSGSVILGWGLAGSVAISLIFLCACTFMLFIRQRFSILLWILYLCAVEILPVATAVIVAGKLRIF